MMFHMEQWRHRCALALLVALLAAIPATADPALDDAFQQAVDAHQLQENAVLLALRLAGIVWIAVEWVAAVVLAIGFHRLRSIARQRGLLP